jgi:hypothetical protein
MNAADAPNLDGIERGQKLNPQMELPTRAEISSLWTHPDAGHRDGYEGDPADQGGPRTESDASDRGGLVRHERRRSESRAAGCDHYVTKPYSPLQLSRVSRALLGEKV